MFNKKSNRKGQVIDLITGTVIAIVIMIFIIFALLFGISSLNPAGFFTAGSASNNATLALQTNTTGLIQNFSQQLPTAGTIFGIVLLLAVLGILILMIVRWKEHSSMSGTGGSL